MPEPSNARARGEAEVRPGSMTRAMQAVSTGARGERWLRWALVRDGKIEREAVVPPDRGVTIGVDGDIASAEPPRSLASFADGAWTLFVARDWPGRIGGQRVHEIDAPRDAEGVSAIRLREGGHARVEIGGGAAILVQLVDRPFAKHAPALPASVKGGILARADWWFTAFVTGSVMLHFAFVVGLLEADWPIQQALIPDRYVEAIFTEPPEPVEPPQLAMTGEPETSTDVSETTVPDAPPSHQRTAPSRPRHAQRSSDPSPSLDADADARRALAAVQLQIGAQLGANGAIRDLIEQGASTPDQASLVEETDSVVASNDDPGAVRERDSSVGCPSCNGGREIGRLAASRHGNRQMGEGEPVIERVIVQPDPEGPIIDDPAPGFDSRELIRALRMRMPAVQRCYEHELTQGNPDAEGRLSISLTVMPVGSVSDVHAAENTTGSDALAACTVRSLRAVRVSRGPEEPVEVEYPIVFHRPR